LEELAPEDGVFGPLSRSEQSGAAGERVAGRQPLATNH
jgi:hypothetical protein